jgi:hypothetical protein
MPADLQLFFSGAAQLATRPALRPVLYPAFYPNSRAITFALLQQHLRTARVEPIPPPAPEPTMHTS